MDIRNYLAILGRRKWIVLFTAAFTIAVAALVSYSMTPLYAATATVRVATAVLGRVDYGDYVYSERLMNTYAEMITAKPVLNEVRERLNLDILPQIEVQVVPDTELLRITAIGPDPLIVRDVANAMTDVLQSKSQEFYTGGGKSAHQILGELVAQAESELAQARSEREAVMRDAPDDTDRIEALSRTVEFKEQTFALLLSQYENARLSETMRANAISVVEPATRPWAPSKPRIVINLVMGALVGLAAGLSLGLVFENMDSTLYTTEEINSIAEPPILGRVPVAKHIEIGYDRLRFSTNGFSAQHEAYRRLRTNIFALSSERRLKTLMATSAERGEGKSTIVANLASTFAEIGQHVLVVDADLRLPSLHRILKLPNDIGCSNVLLQEVTLDKAVQSSEVSGLYVLTSGPQPANPTELLSSASMRELIKELSQRFDVVLIDTPCVLSVTDAAIVGPLVDGVVLVVNRGQARRETVRAALRQLADVKANTIGVVVNRAERGPRY